MAAAQCSVGRWCPLVVLPVGLRPAAAAICTGSSIRQLEIVFQNFLKRKQPVILSQEFGFDMKRKLRNTHHKLLLCIQRGTLF
jgi:hypothetical protein